MVQPWECTFLGFSFTSGPEPKRRIAPQAIERLKERIRKLTRRTRTVGLKQMVEELAQYLIGWNGYFGFGQTIDVPKKLDSWIRRRLRCFVWKQWKQGIGQIVKSVTAHRLPFTFYDFNGINDFPLTVHRLPLT